VRSMKGICKTTTDDGDDDQIPPGPCDTTRFRTLAVILEFVVLGTEDLWTVNLLWWGVGLEMMMVNCTITVPREEGLDGWNLLGDRR
jgi:hypothetical protein